MTTNSRVFVVNEPLFYQDGEWRKAINLTPARDFGTLVHLLPAGELPSDMESVVATLRERLADYRPESDYLLLTGDPRAIAAAAAIAAARGRGRLRLLHWQRRQKCYDLVDLSVGESVDG